MIDEDLRTGAIAWLPPDATPTGEGAFVLGGGLATRAVTPAGALLWELAHGDRVISLDYDPKSRTLLQTTRSGCGVELDPLQAEDADVAIGFKPPKERRRWICWWNEQKQPMFW